METKSNSQVQPEKPEQDADREDEQHLNKEDEREHERHHHFEYTPHHISHGHKGIGPNHEPGTL